MPSKIISLIPPGESNEITGVPTAQLSKKTLGKPSTNEPFKKRLLFLK